jgi:hypothetical protein
MAEMKFLGLHVAAAFLIALSSLVCAQQQQPSSSSKNTKPEQHIKRDSPSDLAPKIYRNPTYSFSYKVPFGWVERTREMQADDSGAASDATSGKVLLAVFERPPQAVGETVNSAVVIVEEPAASYPGLNSALDYLGPVNDLAINKGFHADGDPSEVTIGSRTLVRGDFSRNLGSLTMRQSTLILLQKPSVVSFTFIGGSEDEIAQLIDALNFTAAPRPSKK